MSGFFKAYYVKHEQYYYSHLPDLASDRGFGVSMSHEGGGVSWEFHIDEVPGIGFQLGVFDDAWRAFAEVPELFAGLAELGEHGDMEDVRALLDSLDFKDTTRREV